MKEEHAAYELDGFIRFVYSLRGKTMRYPEWAVRLDGWSTFRI